MHFVIQYVYTGCLNPEAFRRLGAVYRRLKEAKGINGPVPTQLSEDETKIDSSIVFDITTNTLVGFCGDKGDAHACSMDGVRVALPRGPDGIYHVKYHDDWAYVLAWPSSACHACGLPLPCHSGTLADF